MNWINAFMFSVINRLFKILGCRAIFISSTGVKCINQSLSSDYLRSLKVIAEMDLDPSDLYLGFDGLKNAYTLLDRSINNSPHFEFVEAMNNQNRYTKTDYFKRFIGGMLDLRYNQCPFLYDFESLFKAKKKLISTDENQPVLVTKINQKPYILDGKHTASLSLVLGKKQKCLFLDNPYDHPFYALLLKKMEKDGKNFSKNIEFLKRATAQ